MRGPRPGCSDMKCSLYIDNFRGFTDTVIPIADVNFLVGENSTGKTSVLGILSLLSRYEFFVNEGFADAQVRFGAFSDIVSAHSSDRAYFRIGLVREGVADNGQKDIAGYLLTFKQRDGLPWLHHFTIQRGTEQISARIGPKQVRYKHSACGAADSLEEMVSSFFPQWAKHHSAEATDGYARAGSRRDEILGNSLFLSLAIVGSEVRNSAGAIRSGSAPCLTYSLNDLRLLNTICWVAPIRSKPRRTYDEPNLEFSPEGEHTPYLIRKLLRSRQRGVAFRRALRQFGKSSGLFQDVTTKAYGHGPSTPFEVDAVLGGMPINLNSVGYGVSQSLPVLVELLGRGHGTWFAIQQPEVHLHPRAQAALGDIFFEAAARDHKMLFIETHSDFAIDRFRLNYRRDMEDTDKPGAQILFFERRARGNRVTPIAIGSNGDLPEDQPDSYRSFFLHEQMRLLDL